MTNQKTLTSFLLLKQNCPLSPFLIPILTLHSTIFDFSAEILFLLVQKFLPIRTHTIYSFFEETREIINITLDNMSGTLEETKVLKDFTAEVDEKVPAAHKLAQNDYLEAIEGEY